MIFEVFQLRDFGAANVKRGGTVVVVGDGAVGLLGVLAAKHKGAGRYLPHLIDLTLKGDFHPGKVFDLTPPLDQVAEGYRTMDAAGPSRPYCVRRLVLIGREALNL